MVSIDYRFIPQAEADGLVPPVKGPLLDAARALQFIRTKAEEWKIDSRRIGASGSSTGACSALWLAFHPDLAEPQSAQQRCASPRGCDQAVGIQPRWGWHS